MDLNVVTEALKKLTHHNVSETESLLESGDSEESDYFCVEDAFLSKNLCVTVDGIGKLNYPLTQDVIDDLIKFSSRAKFGRGEETVLDTDVRDTQMIPANKLNVEINEECLTSVLDKIGSGLNIDKGSKLVPHLHNMLIYGPGQFFKMHKDSEKMKNMVATLVILLPSAHKGGDLIVKHNSKTHVFFGSQNFEFIKCVVFYSDCEHEVKKVIEGYRIALTYNVVIESPEIVRGNVDNDLDTAVNQYFSRSDQPKKIVFLLNHSYSEHSLKWGLLKGTDRTHAHAMYTVAKNQGRIPCLALAKYNETFDAFDESEVLCSGTHLYHWIDDINLKFLEYCSVRDTEVCYTIETTELFEPYKTEESGPTGNEGETRDHWYRRACVVIWSNKWVFSHGFEQSLYDLHFLTLDKGNEKCILDTIDNLQSHFYEHRFWQGKEVINALIDIAIYVHDPETAVRILSNLPGKVLEQGHMGQFFALEKRYNGDVWEKVITSWKKNYSCWNKIMESTITFVQRYIETGNKISHLVETLLKESVEHFIKSNKTVQAQSFYRFSTFFPRDSKTKEEKCRTDKNTFDNLSILLQNCANLNQPCLEKKLFDYILATPSVYPILSVAELFLKMQSLLRPNQFLNYKHFRESVLNVVHKQISGLNLSPDDWNLLITMPCNCKFCTPVQAFFNSKTAKRVVVPASKDNRRHVYSYLNPLSDQPIKFYTERTGSPLKIIIEKEPNLLEDRKKLCNDLLQLEKQLQEVIFVESSQLNELEESSIFIQAVDVVEPVEQSQDRNMAENPISQELPEEIPEKRQKLEKDPENF